MHRVKKFVFKITAVAMATVVAVPLGGYGLEWFLDWQASKIPDDDGGETLTFGMRTRRNRFGFRDEEFAIPKPPGVYRILALGDSFTFGVGLSEDARYTELLKLFLEVRCPKESIEVLNAGVSGWSTTKERDWLKDHIDAVQPDCVVIGFCVNDPKAKGAEWSPEYELWTTRLRWMKTIGLERVNRHLIGKTLPAVGLMPTPNSALDSSYAPDSLDWQTFTDALQDMAELCRERSTALVFISLLYQNGDYGSPDENLRFILKWTSRAEDAARDAGIEVLSVEPQFRAQGNKVRWVNRWDAHPNGACQEIYARKLAEKIGRLIKERE